MSIRVNESSMVHPAAKTPKTSLWLSKLDMMIRQPYSHTPLLFFYQPNTSSETNAKSSTFFDVEILKSAFSRALVPYDPFAGRLKMDENENENRYVIDCNGEGALFVEAEATFELSNLTNECKPGYKLRQQLFPVCDYSRGISSFPLLMVQITRFSCGSVTLATASHHHAADGNSFMEFMNFWATLARKLKPSVMPCHDRFRFLGPRYPPRVDFKHLEYEPSFPSVPPRRLSGEVLTTTECLLKLTHEQINALKLTAMSPNVVVTNNLSTFKVISAHIWRSVCKARELADDQDVKLYMHTNGRRRLKDPSLPEGYFGNVIFFACCVAKAGDIVHKPLWYTMSKIDEALKRMENSDYLRSAIDYLESRDVTELVRGANTVTCPNLQINSWTGMPFSLTDFGWGGPVSVEQGGIKCEGQSKVISSLTSDKSIYVSIRLFTSHMDLFHKYFYDFLKGSRL